MIIQFICDHWADVLLSLISAGLLAFCRYLYKEMTKYKKLLEQQDQQEIEKLIDDRIQLLKEEVQEIYHIIQEIDKRHERQLEVILTSYRYRLIALCKAHLERGFMTTEEFEQLSELWKVYSGLGGNDQGEDYYKRTIVLPVKDNIK